MMDISISLISLVYQFLHFVCNLPFFGATVTKLNMHCSAEWIEVELCFAVMIQTFELLFDSLWQDKLRTTMTGWKSSQRSDSGRTTILASIQVFYFLIQEDGYLTLIIISGSFIQEHQSCSIRQILTTTRATWNSSLPRWTTVNTIHFMFREGEHFY